MSAISIGLDLGQKHDPTAIVVAEMERRERPDRPHEKEAHYLIRRAERLPLGTSYVDVAERVAGICAGVVARTGSKPRLFPDATGLGQPVIDLLRDAGVQAEIYSTYFTHGDRRTVESGEVKLGKAYLVSRLQALLQSGRLHLPKTAEADVLAKELLDYEIRVDENANDRYGAFKVGSHDDLVTALGLATQVDPVEIPVVAPVGGTKQSLWRAAGELRASPFRPGRWP